ncbi:hypothetical protein GMRT_15878 [Giardia muris]|uniref:Uncharacterized protein n=1 Tax=Giardia muris TaxID=5742 RepID=A0A4Z1SVZ6_GIAMU|nr:hypothetical protein GMRT_15878 [Giardia muris]|eukprot:TNJ29926.1 hypothetical protein GMRT_15878 [Giardia muris]
MISVFDLDSPVARALSDIPGTQMVIGREAEAEVVVIPFEKYRPDLIEMVTLNLLVIYGTNSYQCFTRVRPIGVQDSTLARQPLAHTALDVLREDTTGWLRSILDRAQRQDISGIDMHPLQRRARALLSTLSRAHTYEIRMSFEPERPHETEENDKGDNELGVTELLWCALRAEVVGFLEGESTPSTQLWTPARLLLTS